MATFSRVQIEQQLRDELIKAGYSESVARLAATAGGRKYTSSATPTIAGALAEAKLHAKAYRRVRDMPPKRVLNNK